MALNYSGSTHSDQSFVQLSDMTINTTNTPALSTVFPHIRPAGIIFLQGLQLRVLLERGY